MNSLKQRIVSGWNWMRILYLLMGTMVVVQSVILKQWVGVLLGGYFAMMGLFALGCAGGACYTNYNKKTKN